MALGRVLFVALFLALAISFVDSAGSAGGKSAAGKSAGGKSAGSAGGNSAAASAASSAGGAGDWPPVPTPLPGGEGPVERDMIPTWVRRFLGFGALIMLAGFGYAVYAAVQAEGDKSLHLCCVGILLLAFLAYMLEFYLGFSATLVLGSWYNMHSPRIVLWLRYFELAFTAPIFMLCIAMVARSGQGSLWGTLATYTGAFVSLTIGAFVHAPDKWWFLAGYFLFVIATGAQLYFGLTAAALTLPKPRADLAYTLCGIVGVCCSAYALLWVLGPEGTFKMYLSHVRIPPFRLHDSRQITFLTMLVDALYHVGFCMMLLTSTAALDNVGYYQSAPLLGSQRYSPQQHSNVIPAAQPTHSRTLPVSRASTDGRTSELV